MTAPFRIALAQIDAVVGDIAGNEARIAEQIVAARDGGAQLVCFPELALTGYPPEDLLLKEHFLADARAAVRRLAAGTHGIVAVVGYPERAEDVHNAAALLADGALQASYRKLHLPNYGVFDELRYFQPGARGATFEVDGVTIGLTVCEDVWQPGPPLSDEALAGARLIVNISASPYHAGKGPQRERMIAQRARDDLAAVAFCALVGGQDELVFDGHSFVVDHDGAVIARAPQFREALLFADVDTVAAGSARLRDTRRRAPARTASAAVDRLGSFGVRGDAAGEASAAPAAQPAIAPLLEEVEEIYAALVLGTRDYVRKNGFEHVVLGLSGGIDSTLVALIAVDAVGAEAVTCVTMPSPFSSSGTRSDAGVLAANLGVELLELPIEPMMRSFAGALETPFAGREHDLTEENLQARIRGNLLMALSNKFGWLVLTTGNKSEMSVGYSTLYGDSAGGFAVIKDVPKQLVYRLARRRDERAGGVLVPADLFTRPPSAELRADQRDDDSLPPYEILDAILEGYVERDLGRDQLVARGLPAADVDRVIRLVDLAEYKRRQQPPGIKVTTRAFGRDRRLPITNRYRG
ncbi:MAG TPA: NAD+ synthase [Solirubrobacteraceae bacterium]|nr:NAD+ synthase [Solirubrobacteraceae bacterium]